MSWPWSQLGLPGPSGLSEIRHAYAEKLKDTHPEEDPEGFQRLHAAYQLASRMARQRKRRAEAADPETERPGRPAPEQPQPPEDFSFDELLQEDGVQPRRPREKGPDWDYDRLFAEGEAERAEYRRRRGEERRKERQRQWDSREERLNLQFRQEQERWQDTETILHIMERMYDSRAEPETWKKFFLGDMFQQNRDGLDLIFGLEDFLSGRELSQEARAALFLAYGFDKGVSRPEQRPLFQMLLPAWKAERKAKAFPWKLMLLGWLGSLVFLFGIGPLLDSGLISIALYAVALAVIVWVVRRVAVRAGQEGRVRDRSKKQERRSLILAVVCVAAAFVGLSWLRSDGNGFQSQKDPREQVCRYMEEDLGVQVGALYNLSDSYATETYSNVFYLKDDHGSRRFLAGPDGERDVRAGRSGYTTNLPEMMMLWALKDFAAEQNIYGVDTLDRGLNLEQWETGGTFVLTLPVGGAGEVITGLGALLEELSREAWYQARPPVCEVVLCGGQMVEGRLILSRWHPDDGSFDAKGLRELYEASFAHSYCAQLLKELGLDRDFIQGEGEPYTLTNEGVAAVRGRECYKLCGLDGSGAVALEYYVDLGERGIYCVPGDFWEAGGSEDQIHFYRLLHWGSDLGVFHLFYPWLRTS